MPETLKYRSNRLKAKNVFKYLSRFQPQKNPSGGCSEKVEEKISKNKKIIYWSWWKYWKTSAFDNLSLEFKIVNTLSYKKTILSHLTPSVPHVPFWDGASLTAFSAHSRYSEFLDPKCLLSSNSISYRLVNTDFFSELSECCHNYESTWRIALFRIYHSLVESNQR